jgi:hypothetical protein
MFTLESWKLPRDADVHLAWFQDARPGVEDYCHGAIEAHTVKVEAHTEVLNAGTSEALPGGAEAHHGVIKVHPRDVEAHNGVGEDHPGGSIKVVTD